MTKRIIAHIDMDAFFAAIEERDNPRLRGLPIVVGADPRNGTGRGVVSTANYAARKYGIHSALPITRAWRASEKAKKEGQPEAVFIVPNMEKYQKVSKKIMNIIHEFISTVEQVSVDEAYADVSFAKTYARAKEIAQKIKKQIKEREGLTASVGIGPNKLIAKIASDQEKPDGLTVIEEKEVLNFLAPLDAIVIPGIGPKTKARLESEGYVTIGDVRRLKREELVEKFGKWGGVFYEKARGIDETELVTHRDLKSIGEQETFLKDTNLPGEVSEKVKQLSQTVYQRFKKQKFKTFQRIVLTVRFDDFETITRSKTLESPRSDKKTIEFESLHLLLPFFDQRENPQKKSFRLLGVRVEKLA